MPRHSTVLSARGSQEAGRHRCLFAPLAFQQQSSNLASLHVNVNDIHQMIRADTMWSGSPTETALVKDTMSLKFPVVHVIDIQNPIDNAVALKA